MRVKNFAANLLLNFAIDVYRSIIAGTPTPSSARKKNKEKGLQILVGTITPSLLLFRPVAAFCFVVFRGISSRRTRS